MVDIGFEPTSIEASAGETIRFVFQNAGAVDHDAFIGDARAQEDHGEAMASTHGGHGEDSDAAVTVEPGETGELVHTFDEPGELLIGCHQPGHYEGGMRLSVNVQNS